MVGGSAESLRFQRGARLADIHRNQAVGQGVLARQAFSVVIRDA